MEKNVLVITDDENSKIVRTLLKYKIFPVIRRSIPSAIQILKFLNVGAIIIEDEHKSVDTLEFVLNIRDINLNTPILISNRYQKHKVINKIKNFGQIIIFDETDNNLDSKIKKIVLN